MPTGRKKDAAQRGDLIDTLAARFAKNMARHPGLDWAKVKARLQSKAEKMRALQAMENTGGEPDVIGEDKSGAIIFADCSPQSPDRRSLCYDRAALNARRENKPKNDAMSVAADMGVELMTEAEYRALQKLGEFDTKTSSWLKTPPEIRGLGGATYGDRRYDTVWVYHNGADSYYAARGFRAILKV